MGHLMSYITDQQADDIINVQIAKHHKTLREASDHWKSEIVSCKKEIEAQCELLKAHIKKQSTSYNFENRINLLDLIIEIEIREIYINVDNKDNVSCSLLLVTTGTRNNKPVFADRNTISYNLSADDTIDIKNAFKRKSHALTQLTTYEGIRKGFNGRIREIKGIVSNLRLQGLSVQQILDHPDLQSAIKVLLPESTQQ